MKVRVKEVNPLKQGLKLLERQYENTEVSTVKEVNPLKQGLKPGKSIMDGLVVDRVLKK